MIKTKPYELEPQMRTVQVYEEDYQFYKELKKYLQKTLKHRGVKYPDIHHILANVTKHEVLMQYVEMLQKLELEQEPYEQIRV